MLRLRAVVFACAVWAALATDPSLAAERDYEFGIELLRTFGFADLAEAHFRRLSTETGADARRTAELGLAHTLYHKARTARREGRTDEAERLFEKARTRFEGFIERSPADPRAASAREALGELRWQRVLAHFDEFSAAREPHKRRAALRAAKSAFEGVSMWIGENRTATRRAYEAALARDDDGAAEALLQPMSTATRQYYHLHTRFLESMPLDDRDRKATLARLLRDVVADGEFYWAIPEASSVVMWLDLTRGHLHALDGDYEKACEHGFDLVLAEDATPLRGRARRFVDDVRLTAYYLKSKAAMDLRRHADVVATVDALFTPPPTGYPDALRDHRGARALLLKAEALLEMEEPDFEAAAALCQRVVTRGPASVRGSAGTLLGRVHKAGASSGLSAQALIAAARQAYRNARARADAADRDAGLQHSVDLYRAATRACNRPGAAPAELVDCEPSAWFEMGVCYAKMGLYYEAGLAFESVIVRSSPEALKRRLSGELSPGALRLDKASLDDIVATLDVKSQMDALTRRVAKSARNLVIVARKQMKGSGWEYDRSLYKRAARLSISADPASEARLNYELAAAELSEAEALISANDVAAAVERLTNAARTYGEAANDPSLAARAHHAAGKAYYRAVQVARRSKAKGIDGASLARRAISAFGRAAECDRPAAHSKEALRRSTEARLAAPGLYLALSEYVKAVEAAEDFLRTSDSGDANRRAIQVVRLTAAQRLIMASTDSRVPTCLLESLEAAARDLMASEKGTRLASSVCSMAAAAFDHAAAQFERCEGPRVPDLAARYRRLSLSWLERRAAVDERQITDIRSVLRTSRDLRAGGLVTSARSLLAKGLALHDPDNDGIGAPLDEKLFERAARAVVLDDEGETDALRARIRALGRLAHIREQGRDWDAAARECEALLKAYPDINVSNVLADAFAELERRLLILEARLSYAECCKELAERANDGEPEEARSLYAEAVVAFRAVRSYYARVSSLRMAQAECHEALGEFDDALALYAESARHATPFSEVDYIARTRSSRILFSLKRYQEASAFANVLLLTVPESQWKPHFPDAREFVHKCEARSGTRPAPPEIEDADYDSPSAADGVLLATLTGIDRRIRLGFEEAPNRNALRRQAIEHHLTALITQAVEEPLDHHRAGRLTRTQAESKQREYLGKLMRSSPFRAKILREMSVELGILKGADDPIPERLVPPSIRDRARRLGLVGDEATAPQGR